LPGGNSQSEDPTAFCLEFFEFFESVANATTTRSYQVVLDSADCFSLPEMDDVKGSYCMREYPTKKEREEIFGNPKRKNRTLFQSEIFFKKRNFLQHF
jgi:hypothetical protein